MKIENETTLVRTFGVVHPTLWAKKMNEEMPTLSFKVMCWMTILEIPPSLPLSIRISMNNTSYLLRAENSFETTEFTQPVSKFQHLTLGPILPCFYLKRSE